LSPTKLRFASDVKTYQRACMSHGSFMHRRSDSHAQNSSEEPCRGTISTPACWETTV